MIRGADLASDVCLDSAQQNALAADACKQLLEEEGCGGLAVRSGDSAELKFALGVAEDCSAPFGQCAASMLD